jgi:uncharacterized membrane protein YqjE
VASLWGDTDRHAARSQTQAPGSLASLRRLLAGAASLTRIRLELLGLELQLERHRWVLLLWWGSLSAWLAAAGLGLLATALSLSLWPAQPVTALGAAAVALLTLAGACAAWLRRQLGRMEPPLGMSAQQWRDDHSALTAPDHPPSANGLP